METHNSIQQPNIQLFWHIFGMKSNNNNFSWSDKCYYNKYNYDLLLMQFNYWGPFPNSKMQISKGDISHEELCKIFTNNIITKIPTYKGNPCIICPIYISKENEWHMGIVFLLDNTCESNIFYNSLNKMFQYYKNRKLLLIKIPKFEIIGKNIKIKFGSYETPSEDIWNIEYGISNDNDIEIIIETKIKMRLSHILKAVNKYLPDIKIQY